MSQNIKPLQRPPFAPLTDERTKEIILETLIELGLIAQPERKKLMP